MTQRERLATELTVTLREQHDAFIAEPESFDSHEAIAAFLADALLARGVRLDEPVPAGEREGVYCDEEGCEALAEPVTLEEYRAALEHWREHGYLAGCSHGN